MTQKSQKWKSKTYLHISKLIPEVVIAVTGESLDVTGKETGWWHQCSPHREWSRKDIIVSLSHFDVYKAKSSLEQRMHSRNYRHVEWAAVTMDSDRSWSNFTSWMEIKYSSDWHCCGQTHSAFTSRLMQVWGCRSFTRNH